MLSPIALPDAAVPVTTLGLEDVTVVADSAPVRLLSACTSESRLLASVWIWVSALVWLSRVLICDCQVSSGPSAADTAEFTAEVTSIPGVDAPSAASRMALRLIEDDESDDPSNELSKEVELMDVMPSFFQWVAVPVAQRASSMDTPQSHYRQVQRFT
jgi:hypothetical protein